MHQFQKEATDITLPNTFGLDYQYLILKFTAEYEEAQGNNLIIFSIGSEDNLIQQYSSISTIDTYFETIWEIIKIVESIGQPN